jgi:hypothetical protein
MEISISKNNLDNQIMILNTNYNNEIERLKNEVRILEEKDKEKCGKKILLNYIIKYINKRKQYRNS